MVFKQTKYIMGNVFNINESNIHSKTVKDFDEKDIYVCCDTSNTESKQSQVVIAKKDGIIFVLDIIEKNGN